MNVRPWLRHYGGIPAGLVYPRTTLYGAVRETAARVPAAIAFDFFGNEASYAELVAHIDRCAAGLARLGVVAGDRVLISMPTCPQGVIGFYAANKLGAAAAMVHPLSTSLEMAGYLAATGARVALTLDAFHGTFARTPPEVRPRHLVVARIAEFLPPLQRPGYWLARGRRIPPVPRDASVVPWQELCKAGETAAAGAPQDAAAILFSGGTTGLPKGIVLSNASVIAAGLQAATWARMAAGDSILAILPIFHGFGLGVCVNAAFMGGGKSILVSTFTPRSVARLIRAKRPSLLVGVPSLFEALAREPAFARADLSCLRAAFSGGDTLPRPVKEAFEAAVRARGGSIRLLEGYGLTEAVTGIMAMPPGEYREGSIGIPFPDMDAAICRVGTTEHLAPGEEGEICIAGPALMEGYLGDPAATAQALRRHGDGRIWLHTGDLGRMDAEGFFHFAGRLKRMIKSSGFNVYPAQVEAVLHRHAAVSQACVVGVPDPAQVERVRAYVVPKPPAVACDELAARLIAHCRSELIKWSCPREVVFRARLPVTRIGKIDYRALADEARAEGS